MGSCRNKKLIGPLLDGQLGECRWLEEHINGCPECLAEYEAIQKIFHMTTRSDFAPPEGTYWKGFVTRVSARIATCRVPRRRIGLLGTRLAAGFIFRVGAPLAIAAILIAVWFLVKSPHEAALTASHISAGTDKEVSTEKMATRAAATDRKAITSSREMRPPLASSAGGRADGAEKAGAPAEAASDKQDAGIVQVSLHSPDALASAVFQRLDSLNRRSDYQPGELPISDLARGMQLIDSRLLSFDTKQILKFQMFAGSNSSLAPISMYHEAARRFFAPVQSNSRVTFSSNTQGNWGYGLGDDIIDRDRLYHLKMELYLLHDK